MADLIAVYPDVAQAREALVHLERTGIEAGNIELLGPGMEGAHEAQTNLEQQTADEAVIRQAEKRGGIGIAVGAVLGAILVTAFAAAADALFDIGDNLGQLLVGAAIAGAMFGAFAGFFYGGATGLPVNEAWGETFEAVKGGKTVVAVHLEDPDELRAAEKALRDTKPLTVSGGTTGA